MPVYQVKPGYRFGLDLSHPATVELTEDEAAGFLDKLEPATIEVGEPTTIEVLPIADMTIKELRAMAAGLGIDGTGSMKKADLIAAIENA